MGSGLTPYSYSPGLQIHPGASLLPPSYLKNYNSLPSSVAGQFLDDSSYDYFGKSGRFFEDGLLDRPTGKALKDYELWLKQNPDIEKELDDMIMKQLEKSKISSHPLDDWSSSSNNAVAEVTEPSSPSDPQVTDQSST
mmetsp:Transcript_2494/g.4194  ORF Transcript_2494/g.4194 Transcript_2494/m.4194 type:complete len:138 (+) Transcript_2494:57-470(+)